LSNDLFEDETRMHPRAMKVQRNGHKVPRRHPITEKQKQLINTRSISFLIHSCSTNCGFINNYYYVTLPVHSHAEVNIVMGYLRQSFSWDVLGQGPCNHAGQWRRNGGAWRVHCPPVFWKRGNGATGALT